MENFSFSLDFRDVLWYYVVKEKNERTDTMKNTKNTKNTKAKAKKNLVIAGTSLVCAALVCVTVSRFAAEQNAPPDRTYAETEPAEIVTTVVTTLPNDMKEPEITMTVKSEKAAETTAVSETEAKPMTEVDRSFKEITKPATEPPPPTVEDEAALTDPAAPPEYEPPQTTVTAAPEPKADTPQHGETKDGKIYINGFGWVKDEGGEVHGETAADMYQNGNKIGSFG